MARLVLGMMRINAMGTGISERYYFKADVADALTAVPIMKNIVWGRSAFLGEGCTIEYARCSLIGKPPDKETVFMDYPIGPHPSWTGGANPGDTISAPNDPTSCVQQVFQLTGGKWINRYYHYLPDLWVLNRKLGTGIRQYFTPAADTGSDPDLSPTGGLGHLEVCQKFWRLLVRRTVGTKKNTPIDYTPTEIRDIGFVQVTNHKVGHPFRLSAGKRPANTIR